MYMRVVTACPTCRGKGRLIDAPCSNCHGSGLVRKRRKITVKIPTGIDDGYQLRLRGEGEMVANDGEPGDLYVIVHVKQQPQFIREGDDLWHVAIITYPQAALGAEISVPTLDGPTTVKVHAGTQVGEVITLRGKGMPRLEAMAGAICSCASALRCLKSLRLGRRRFWSSWRKNSARMWRRRATSSACRQSG